MDKANHRFAFQKVNFKWLLIGLAINFFGFILMIGGESPDPTKFDAKELFSPIRITLAPILVVIGYLVIIYAIMKKPKNNSEVIK
ncbi:MAG: hypothetical protein RL728_420 [Bacteroidota bacterium]|jgi:hypothetical protein